MSDPTKGAQRPPLAGAAGSAMGSRRIAISHDTVCGILWIITAAGCVAGQGFIGFVGVVSGFLICAYLYPKSPNSGISDLQSQYPLRNTPPKAEESQ